MTMKISLNAIKDDLIAGIIVFLVAIPLCLGIALASDAPLFAGILSGIIGGIIVGGISQSRVSVSGPAAGMIAIVVSAIATLGGFENFLLALMLAGAIQILVSVFRAGFIADYIPGSVIQGLLCAIGVLIVIKQLPLAFTHTEQHAELREILKESAQNLQIFNLISIKNHINWGAALIAVTSFALLIYTDYSKKKYLKIIPSTILVVLMGILFNEIYIYIMPNLIQTNVQLVNIPVNEHIHEWLNQFTLPNWHQWLSPNVYLYGFIIAAVASLETLLNLEAAEKLDGKRKYCSRNRELFAQGVGNMLAGLLGGIPITSVVIRSSVNIQSGAKSKMATITHGLLFMVTLLTIPEWLNKIPLASLAAILIYVGLKLIKVSIYRGIYKKKFIYYFPFLMTVTAILITNILVGVIIGLFCAIFLILKENSQMRFDIVEERHPSGLIHRLILPEQLSFLKKASLLTELQAIPDNVRMVIDARATKYIDSDILEVIKDFTKNVTYTKGIELNLIGFKSDYKINNKIRFINATTYDVQASLSPNEVIKILQEGNQRFVKDQRINRYFPSEVKATANGQHPLAVVLSCIDSRLPVETIFDMGIGDLFIIRIAGNIVNDDIIGSIEFACKLAKAKLILVLGHTRCGAIKAACEYTENGYIQKLLNKIRPAIEVCDLKQAETDEEFLTQITQKNIENSLASIYLGSEELKKLVDDGEVGLTSAIYDIRSGIVTWGRNKPLRG